MINTIDIACYADENTPCNIGKNQCDQQAKLQKASVKLFKWFYENGMKVHQDEYHFLLILEISTKFSLPACILENSDS